MLLSLFLIDLAAGLYLFLPLVGRRNAGVKFYRLVLITSGILAFCSAIAVRWNLIPVALTLVVYFVLRYPKRIIYRASAVLLAIAYLVCAVHTYNTAVRPPHLGWSIAGALASVALLGSVNLAMLLGHWYLVVRGMAIDPLKRLTHATLITTITRLLLVAVALYLAPAMLRDIFFWMRAGWGLIIPLLLYPMVWGTVRIRSTMAATGILYVEVVAVVIGEVLGGWLGKMMHLPM